MVLGQKFAYRVAQRATVTAECYRGEILNPSARPFAGAIGDQSVLMHNNSSPHTPRLTMNYHARESMYVMDWPVRIASFKPF